jgi:hypothetical protein
MLPKLSVSIAYIVFVHVPVIDNILELLISSELVLFKTSLVGISVFIELFKVNATIL